jgi:Mg2+-importing ATPase
MTREYNEDGFRVIAVATCEYPRGATKTHYSMTDEQQLVLRGFLAFLDPPKETAGPAIAALRDHGVQIKILTGDNPVVTRKVCRDVGLSIGTPVLGRDLETLDDAKFCNLVERTTVFAKISPLQKARIIKTLRANGHTVGFLGDGINDAAALRDADVGVSVDTAADIAKESADIILLPDVFDREHHHQLHRAGRDDAVERPQDGSHQGPIGDATGAAKSAISLWPEWIHVSAHRSSRHRWNVRGRRER